MVNFPKRLWSNARNTKNNKNRPSSKSKEKNAVTMMPYIPREIRIDTENQTNKVSRMDNDDDNNRMNHNKEELKFWKNKALVLEGALEKLEEKVTALEKESMIGMMGGGGDIAAASDCGCGVGAGVVRAGRITPRSVLSKSATAMMPINERSLHMMSTSFTPDCATASPSEILPPSPGKIIEEEKKAEKAVVTPEKKKPHNNKKEDDDGSRRDEIMQQLVSEMERLILLHVTKIVVNEKVSNNEEDDARNENEILDNGDKDAGEEGGREDEKDGSDKSGNNNNEDFVNDDVGDGKDEKDSNTNAVDNKDPEKEASDDEKKVSDKDVDDEEKESREDEAIVDAVKDDTVIAYKDDTVVVVDTANNTNDDINLPIRRQILNMETSQLEHLVSKLLETTCPEKVAQPSHSNNNNTKSSKKKSKKHHRVLYQLSCKKCIGQNFVGSASSSLDLETKVHEHFNAIWQVVQTAYHRQREHDGEKDTKDLERTIANVFRASSFAHHVARHCKECAREEEVCRWCVKNVKVERIGKHIR